MNPGSSPPHHHHHHAMAAAESSLVLHNARERQAILRLPRGDLEDRLLRLHEENLLLKQHGHKQEEQLKKLATKLVKLAKDQRRMEQLVPSGGGSGGPAASSSSRPDAETEEMMRELQETVCALRQQNDGLKQRLLLATRRQLQEQLKRRTPYGHVGARVNTGLKRSPGSTPSPPHHPGYLPHDLGGGGGGVKGSPGTGGGGGAGGAVAAAERQLADAEELVRESDFLRDNLRRRERELEEQQQQQLLQQQQQQGAVGVRSGMPAGGHPTSDTAGGGGGTETAMTLRLLQRRLAEKAGAMTEMEQRFAQLQERQRNAGARLEELTAELQEERLRSLALQGQLQRQQQQQQQKEEEEKEKGENDAAAARQHQLPKAQQAADWLWDELSHSEALPERLCAQGEVGEEENRKFRRQRKLTEENRKLQIRLAQQRAEERLNSRAEQAAAAAAEAAAAAAASTTEEDESVAPLESGGTTEEASTLVTSEPEKKLHENKREEDLPQASHDDVAAASHSGRPSTMSTEAVKYRCGEDVPIARDGKRTEEDVNRDVVAEKKQPTRRGGLELPAEVGVEAEAKAEVTGEEKQVTPTQETNGNHARASLNATGAPPPTPSPVPEMELINSKTATSPCGPKAAFAAVPNSSRSRRPRSSDETGVASASVGGGDNQVHEEAIDEGLTGLSHEAHLEVHLGTGRLSPATLRVLRCAGEPCSYVAYTLYRFGPDATPAARGPRPAYDHTARYAVPSPCDFLHYLDDGALDVELHLAQRGGRGFSKVAAGQVRLRPLLERGEVAGEVQLLRLATADDDRTELQPPPQQPRLPQSDVVLVGSVEYRLTMRRSATVAAAAEDEEVPLPEGIGRQSAEQTESCKSREGRQDVGSAGGSDGSRVKPPGVASLLLSRLDFGEHKQQASEAPPGSETVAVTTAKPEVRRGDADADKGAEKTAEEGDRGDLAEERKESESQVHIVTRLQAPTAAVAPATLPKDPRGRHPHPQQQQQAAKHRWSWRSVFSDVIRHTVKPKKMATVAAPVHEGRATPRHSYNA